MSIWSSAIYIYRLFYGWWARTFFIHKLRKTNKRTIYIYIYIYTHKNTHTGTNKRESSFPSNKASFGQAVPPNQKALNECGYQYTPLYEPTTTNKRKNRQRNNILWYNPSFSKNVRTNIGHRFLALVDKQFPKDYKLRKEKRETGESVTECRRVLRGSVNRTILQPFDFFFFFSHSGERVSGGMMY